MTDEKNKGGRKKGGPKIGGRKKGTPNKATVGVIERLQELDCDPIAGLADVAKRALEEGDLSVAASCFKDLAGYVAPKRKAIEVTGANGDAMEIVTPEQALLMAKAMAEGA